MTGEASSRRRTGTSYSSLTQHRRCPQAFNYARLQKLEPVDGIQYPVERDFGIWWHALRAAEAIERGRRADTLVASPEALSTPHRDVEVGASPHGDVYQSLVEWWDHATEDYRAAWSDRLGHESAPEHLTYTLEEWRSRWADEIEHQHPLMVEYRFERDLPSSPQEGDPNSVLVGVVDEVLHDTRLNMVVVRDNKTGKALDAATSTDDLMDSQLHLYAWAVAPDVSDMTGMSVRAIGYDRVRSVAPKPPKLTQTGRLSVLKGEPSVSNCDLTTYLSWSAGPDGEGVPFSGRKKDGSDGGLYVAEDAVVEKLRGQRDRWQQRTLTPLNRNVIRAHLQSAVDTSHDISRTVERVNTSGEAARLFSQSCQWCDFASLCRAQMYGGPEGHYELAEHGLQRRTG